MQFYSTSNRNLRVSLRDALLSGLAPDGGLYMPERIPRLPESFFAGLGKMSFPEIAHAIGKEFVCPDIPESVLEEIVHKAFNFDVPLVPLDDATHILELFHGPTLSFKDFGARFLARLMGYFAEGLKDELTVLVATSGDTGSAVAQGFYGIRHVRVIVLYPKGKISDLQERQIATLGNNVTSLAVEGTFDDCQRMVKSAFADAALRKQVPLTSANSINIGRLIPQSFYYFWAYGQISDGIAVAVPSGNFGNLTAGLLAKRMGLPVEKFIAATNANDVVPEYFATGAYAPKPSKATIANAMDVGDPSNMARIRDMYANSIERMKEDIWPISTGDDEALSAMRRVYEETGYIMDPHTAMGYCALSKSRPPKADPPQAENLEISARPAIILSTAHPAKFPDIVKRAIGKEPPQPPALAEVLGKKKHSVDLPNSYGALKEFLLDL